MEYENFNEFIEEWGQPDSFNFLISSNAPCEIADIWYLDIVQPRKNKVVTIYIKDASHEQIKDWAEKSIEVHKDMFHFLWGQA